MEDERKIQRHKREFYVYFGSLFMFIFGLMMIVYYLGYTYQSTLIYKNDVCINKFCGFKSIEYFKHDDSFKISVFNDNGFDIYSTLEQLGDEVTRYGDFFVNVYCSDDNGKTYIYVVKRQNPLKIEIGEIMKNVIIKAPQGISFKGKLCYLELATYDSLFVYKKTTIETVHFIDLRDY